MKKLGIILLSLALLFGMVPSTVMAAESVAYNEQLNAYLSEVSTERGFEVTKTDLEAYLSAYDLNLTDFTSVDEIRTGLGEVIKSDLSNLGSLYESYQLDEETLIQLLAGNGEELNDYIFISDLDYAVLFYTYDGTTEDDPDSSDGSTSVPAMDEAILAELFEMLDITEAEMTNIEDYYNSLESYFSDPAFLEAFLSWTERISFLEELDGVEELSNEQVEQVAAYFNELFDLMKLSPVISFIQDGEETNVSFEELVQIKDFDFSDTDVKVIIYGTDGTLLADYFVTSDFIDYLDDFYGEIPENVEDLVTEDTTSKPVTQAQNQKPSAPKTEKGGKLPKTSTNNIPYAILGGLLSVVGVLMYKRVTHVKKEATK
ncbi:MAG: processed acidic surface protein [Herbinix sp.]|nr:processed acidic surface protein [Herbinix sp.]